MEQMPLDLSSDLKELAQLAADPHQMDDLLVRTLDYLQEVIPYDLAAVLELSGGELVIRCARGPLASSRLKKHRIHLAEHPSIQMALETRRARVLLEHDHSEGEGDPYDGVLDLPHGHSCMVVPLFAGQRTLGAMTFDRSECIRYKPQVVQIAAVLAQIVALAMVAAEQAAVLDRYRRALEERNRLLQVEVEGESLPEGVLEQSRTPAMRQLVRMARQVASTETPVLITGETGTGKEVLARALHQWSPRRKGPFIKINCAALPEQLVESELFGHTKGAFSGATAARPGRFIVANGGTLLLDEIGDLPLPAQAKLLRVLQEGTFEAVGSDRPVKVDVRILAATHVNLEEAIRLGKFREDLFYRLSVFPLHLPALRERPEDIPLIATNLLESISKRTSRGPWILTPAVESRLKARTWPGNVRELGNTLERASILSERGVLELDDGPAPGGSKGGEVEKVTNLEEVERRHIKKVLASTRGKIYGKGGAAELLGLKPTTLQSRMLKLGIPRVEGS